MALIDIAHWPEMCAADISTPVARANTAISSPGNSHFFISRPVQVLVLCLLLAAATLAIYQPVAGNGFVNYDDDRYILQNLHVRSGLTWQTALWAFTSLEHANWHPLAWLSHALDCQLFQLNPAGHHYMSLVLHVVNALLLFLLLHAITTDMVCSFMVAALFAVHPLNVESVVWIAERKTVLSMSFFLLTLLAYVGYVRRPNAGRYLLAFFLFACALMSKPMAVTLPFILVLLDYWPLQRISPADTKQRALQIPSSSHKQRPWLSLVIEKLPFFAMSLGSAVVTMVAQKRAGAVLSGPAYSLLFRTENAVVSFLRYIGKAVWPSHLAALYPYPASLPVWQVAVSASILLAVTIAVLKYRKKRYLLVGWFWFLGTMLPMIGLVQVGNQSMAERYVYLPFIGLFIMAAWGLSQLARAETKLAAAVAVIVLIAFSVRTRAQIKYWHDDLSLWSHTLAVTDNNFVAENNVAATLIRLGKSDEALAHFRRASAIAPGDATSQLNLGIYAQEHGQLREAAARYQTALQLAGDSQIRASAYANLGSVYFAVRDYPQAKQKFESAMKLNQTFPVALLDLGLIAQKNGDWNQAAGYYSQLANVAPSDAAYLLLSHALEQAGQPRAAQLAFDQAQSVSSDLPRAQQIVSKLLEQ